METGRVQATSLFPRNYFPDERGQRKLKGFCFLAPSLCQERVVPSPAPCPSVGAAGGGTGTLAPLPGPVGQRRWTRSAQPPGKFMSILAREGQEAPRQASGFRHAFLKEMKKENVDIVKWAFPIRKHASQREKKKP